MIDYFLTHFCIWFDNILVFSYLWDKAFYLNIVILYSLCDSSVVFKYFILLLFSVVVHCFFCLFICLLFTVKQLISLEFYL